MRSGIEVRIGNTKTWDMCRGVGGVSTKHRLVGFPW